MIGAVLVSCILPHGSKKILVYGLPDFLSRVVNYLDDACASLPGLFLQQIERLGQERKIHFLLFYDCMHS